MPEATDPAAAPVIHVGFHKTATSWLQKHYFKAHPEIALVNDYKKPQDDRFLSYLIATPTLKFSPEESKTLWQEVVRTEYHGEPAICISAERLSGHPASGGYDRETIAERLSQTIPNARILITVRDQVEIVKSIYNQLLREGYPGTFTDLVRSQQWKCTSFCLAYLEFDLLVEAYANRFGKQNVCVLRFEDFRDSKLAFLEQLASFIGVNNMSADEGVVNPSGESRNTHALRIVNKFRYSEIYPHPLISLSPRMRGHLQAVLSWLPSRAEEYPEDDLAFVADHYRDSNRRLNDLVNADFGYSAFKS